MLKFFLWARYLRKRRLVLLCVAAVALCCGLLIVVASLFTGFIQAVQDSCAAFEGDISIYPAGAFSRYEQLLERLEALPRVETASAVFIGGAGLLHLGAGNVRPVFYAGIEPVRGARLADLKHSLLRQKDSSQQVSFQLPGPADEMGGWAGIGLVAEPDEQTDEYDLQAVRQHIGAPAVLVTGAWMAKNSGLEADTTQGTAGAQTQTFRRVTTSFTIGDIFFTGHYWYDQLLYLPIERIQKAIDPQRAEPVAHAVWIRLAPGVKAEQMIERVGAVWRRFAAEQLGWDSDKIDRTDIYTARQSRWLYLEPVRQQRGILMLILGVICSVGILLVLCIFYMIVITKRRDIAIIKSCGCGSAAVAAIFVGFAGCVGLAGSATGTVLGWLIMKNINAIENSVQVIAGLKLWRSSVYIFNKVPDRVDWQTVCWVALAAVMASVLGAVVPAVVAARTRPVEILRYE